jgi:hypothetical protein
VLQKFSLSVLRAEPNGTYTLKNLSPLYSLDIARPESKLGLIVIGIAFLIIIAVPRIEVPVWWWTSYPLKISVYVFATSWRENMSSSWLFLNSDIIPKLIGAVIPLMLSVAIFMTCIRGGRGI